MSACCSIWRLPRFVCLVRAMYETLIIAIGNVVLQHPSQRLAHSCQGCAKAHRVSGLALTARTSLSDWSPRERAV